MTRPRTFVAEPVSRTKDLRTAEAARRRLKTTRFRSDLNVNGIQAEGKLSAFLVCEVT